MILNFGYLKDHMKLQIICDIIIFDDQVKVELELNWSEIYPYSIKELPPNIPEPKSFPVSIANFLIFIMPMIFKLVSLLLGS